MSEQELVSQQLCECGTHLKCQTTADEIKILKARIDDFERVISNHKEQIDRVSGLVNDFYEDLQN